MQKRIVTINGRSYDTRTGLPVASNTVAKPEPKRQAHSASLHQATQKSQTLNRRFVRNPYAQNSPAPQAQPASSPAPKPVTSTAQKSPSITKFHKEPIKTANTGRVFSDIRPTAHPMVERAAAKQKQNQPVATMPKPSDILKKEAIQASLDAAPSHTHHHQTKKHKSTKRSKWSVARLATAGATLVLVGAYFTYLNMPSLSVRIAAAQAGIDASYPSYRPSGYSLAGPIAYDNGQVRMRFAMNGSDRYFNLDQTKSGWDSNAVYENFVKPKVGEDYTMSRVNGITVYTYENDAAWVNNGILYTVNGDAPLSPEQIQQIASSM